MTSPDLAPRMGTRSAGNRAPSVSTARSVPTALVVLTALAVLPSALLSASIAAAGVDGIGPATVGAGPSPAWTWPLDGVPVVLRRFSPPPRRWLAGHRGVDLAGRSGQLVRAAGDGVVVFAGPVAGRGVVSVGHDGGLRTTYEPVRPLVRKGQDVGGGDVLGVLDPGHPGCAIVACLHWGLRRDDTYLDPLLLVQPGRVRLKPLTHLVSPARVPAAGSSRRRAGRTRCQV
jgi:murein DD-endopeptidase MepM/ murein hydrolase activator NlpD